MVGEWTVTPSTPRPLLSRWSFSHPRLPRSSAQDTIEPGYPRPAHFAWRHCFRECYPAHRGDNVIEGAEQACPSAYLLVSTIGICVDNCKLIRRSIRRSIWYHNAVFLGEITFSNTATYLIRNARSCSSTAFALLMYS